MWYCLIYPQSGWCIVWCIKQSIENPVIVFIPGHMRAHILYISQKQSQEIKSPRRKKIELFAHNKLHMQLITLTSPSHCICTRACVHLFFFAFIPSARALQAVWPPLAASGVSFTFICICDWRPPLCCKRLFCTCLLVVWMHLYFMHRSVRPVACS